MTADAVVEILTHYHGHVQGVGFRYRTERLLRDLPLHGYVKNLDDGSVELRLRGTPPDVDVALSRVAESLSAHIRQVTSTHVQPSPELGAFHIAR
ncbi:MAG: acylphosphatase [Planctomycetes bacterium]|nr:acylphosphatase [Planctomycetota bacterium]